MLSELEIPIPEDVAEELADPRFLTMSHYANKTYSKGCHGPLCKLFKRDKMRRTSQKRASQNGKVYRPVFALREFLVPINRDEELYRIIIAHRIERKVNNSAYNRKTA